MRLIETNQFDSWIFVSSYFTNNYGWSYDFNHLTDVYVDKSRRPQCYIFDFKSDFLADRKYMVMI